MKRKSFGLNCCKFTGLIEVRFVFDYPGILRVPLLVKSIFWEIHDFGINWGGGGAILDWEADPSSSLCLRSLFDDLMYTIVKLGVGVWFSSR